MFVIMDTEHYNDKIHQILSDDTKFTKMEKIPTPQLKKKLRALIDSVHAADSSPRFPKLIGTVTPPQISALAATWSAPPTTH